MSSSLLGNNIPTLVLPSLIYREKVIFIIIDKMTTNGRTKIQAENEVIVPEKKDQPIVWYNVIVLTAIHLSALYSILVIFPNMIFKTLVWNMAYAIIGGFGVTGGAHRYWTHRSYKAKLPLRIIMAACYLIAGMNPIFDWVRDHRVHHKFSETDADPHNSKRGLFFSHVGWLMQKKHPEVLRRGRQVDMSDVLADPVVQFEEKYFKPLIFIFCFAIPIFVPCFFWNETLWNSVFVNMFRWVATLNGVWAVNSFAHIYGAHPYNRKIRPAENRVVSMVALGEGWHNYHHTFPWDYKTAELHSYGMNFTTAFIDFFAYIGWAYDLKEPSQKLVQEVAQQTGDGTHPKWGHLKEVPEEAEAFLNSNNKFEVLLNTEDKAKGI